MLWAAWGHARRQGIVEGRPGVKRSRTVFLVLGLLSLGVVVLILHLVGLRATIGVLLEVGWRAFVAMLLLSLLWLAFGAMAWDRLGRPVGHRVPLWTLFNGMLLGFVGNFVTPSMYVGGEPLRVGYVGQRRRLPYYQVAGTVLLSKYLEFIAFVLLICVGTTVALVFYWGDLSDPLRVVMGVGAGALVGLLALLLVALWGRRRPISAVVEWLIRRGVFRRTLRLRRRRIRQMEDQISHTFTLEGRSAWPALALLAAGCGAIFVRPLVFFYFLKEPRTFSFPELCLIFVLMQFVLGLQITPGSLGTYEGGMIGIFAILGIGEHLALAYVFCMRAVDAVLLLSGLLVATHQGIRVLRVEGQSDEPAGASGDVTMSARQAPADPPHGTPGQATQETSDTDTAGPPPSAADADDRA